MTCATLATLLVAFAASPAEAPVPVAARASMSGSPLSEGDPAPVFKLRSLDGSLVRLDELAYPGKEKGWAKKRPVLIDFFRTDCAPCRKSMPELIEISKTYEARGLQVVLIALLETDDGRAKLDRYLATQKLPFTVVIDETEHFAKKYLGGTVSLPASFLIDRDGIIRSIKHGAGAMKDHFAPAISRALVGG